MPTLKHIFWNVVLFLFASPVLAVVALRRAVHKLRFFLVASRTEIRCECGAAVTLLGLWKCGCGQEVLAAARRCRVSGESPRAPIGGVPARRRNQGQGRT